MLSDLEIRYLSVLKSMIVPFAEQKDRPGVISCGVTSYGYDMRLGRRYKVFRRDQATAGDVIDPKKFKADLEEIDDADFCVIPPNSFALAESFERFSIPREVLAICVGKSTYARVGLILNVTPLEPEWSGKLTLELSNSTPQPIKVYSEEGIGQLVFFKHHHGCQLSYADKKGKYQNQGGLQEPIVH